MTTPGTDPSTASDGVLRDRLRRADPLSGRDVRLDPASLEAVVSELTRTPIDPPSQGLDITPQRPQRRGPRWLWPAAGGLAAASVAAVALSGVLGGAGDDPASAPSAQRPGLVVGVPAGDPSMSMCMQLSPELLAPAQFALDGVVTAVDGDSATITPSHWYRGERAGTVEVAVSSEVQTALVGAPRFEQGGRVLLAGGDGQLGLCGMSDAWSPELEALYRQAFIP